MTESHTGVDPATELLIKLLMDHVDTSLEALKRELKAELTAVFGARHDQLAARMAAIEGRLSASRAEFGEWATELRKDTSYTRFMAAQAWKALFPDKEPEPPSDNHPRPVGFDIAAARPSETAQRVDIPEHQAVVYMKPDANPKVVWANTAENIQEHRQ